jgi:hypothetical protein
MSEFVTKIRTDKGDLQIDYNELANLPALNTMFSNPNLLINSDFRYPVNQREATIYQEASDWTYCIDRWKYFNQMTVQVLDGAVKFASHGDGQSWFMQELERELPANNYTLSVKVSSVSGTCDMKFENSNGVQVEKIIDSTGVTTLSFNGSVNAVSFELNGNGSHLTIEWVKLEHGTIATPFVPKSYAQEVSECQRYYTKSDGVRISVTHGTNNLYLMIPLSTTLRVWPTVTLGKTEITIVHDDSGDATTHTIGSCNVSAVTNTHIILDITSMYNVSVYKSGCIVEGLPIFIDAEIY